MIFLIFLVLTGVSLEKQGRTLVPVVELILYKRPDSTGAPV